MILKDVIILHFWCITKLKKIMKDSVYKIIIHKLSCSLFYCQFSVGKLFLISTGNFIVFRFKYGYKLQYLQLFFCKLVMFGFLIERLVKAPTNMFILKSNEIIFQKVLFMGIFTFDNILRLKESSICDHQRF